MSGEMTPSSGFVLLLWQYKYTLSLRFLALCLRLEHLHNNFLLLNQESTFDPDNKETTWLLYGLTPIISVYIFLLLWNKEPRDCLTCPAHTWRTWSLRRPCWHASWSWRASSEPEAWQPESMRRRNSNETLKMVAHTKSNKTLKSSM